MVDRPVECSNCTKNPSIRYSLVINGTIEQMALCDACPYYQARFPTDATAHDQSIPEKERVCCLGCGCSFLDIVERKTVGCSECYQVFHHLIIETLLKDERLPERDMHKLKHNHSLRLHIGRAGNASDQSTLSSQISTLNTALNDALRNEHYEQAASIRDEIKTLIRNKHGH